MKQKTWTFGDQFTIKDEHGNDRFLIKGKVFSLGDKLSFQDTNGNELAYIAQSLLNFRPVYNIYRNSQPCAKVARQWSLFKDKYTVEIPGSNEYQVRGDFWDYKYEFIKDGYKVAHVSKKLFTWKDTYGVQIADGEDDITILATAVVIDLVNQK